MNGCDGDESNLDAQGSAEEQQPGTAAAVVPRAYSSFGSSSELNSSIAISRGKICLWSLHQRPDRQLICTDGIGKRELDVNKQQAPVMPANMF